MAWEAIHTHLSSSSEPGWSLCGFLETKLKMVSDPSEVSCKVCKNLLKEK